jgi:hypothetical protein
MRKLRLAGQEAGRGGGPVSCLNESESTHCSMNRTRHQPPAAGGIHRRANYGDEHGLVSSRLACMQQLLLVGVDR